MVKSRYLKQAVVDDLKEKMVFVGGPRQVGKTTFATEIVGTSFRKAAYYNWDNRADRQRILRPDWVADADLIILDEIHKYSGWKNLIKGEYDKLKNVFHFLVTGSSRLDVYRRGGDSLQGRYHYYRLHPFSLSEMLNRMPEIEPFQHLDFDERFYPDETAALLDFGGFPEPLLRQNRRTLRRWQNEKLDRMFREDIRDMAQVRDLQNMILLSDFLPERVGSPLSVNSLRQDINVSHRAVSAWLDILESFYYLFRIRPFTANRIRSVRKEPKAYLWDWPEVKKVSLRLENMIASHLLKFCHFIRDMEGFRTELHYLRNVDKREIDFLVSVDTKPWFAVEVKAKTSDLSPNFHYFKERMDVPFWFQVVGADGVDRLIDGVRVISASKFLTGLV
ncbi:MAG: ATP-binding protein [Acidobacteria bacterium]|nr:ATP-binding protein [Acidobacteriota bacterium]